MALFAPVALAPVVLLVALAAGASDAFSEQDLKALDRDDAAAEAAADAGDVSKALRYYDFFGHEQEDFARATLEYGRSQRLLRTAVINRFGRRTWRRAAAALGIRRHDRDRTLRTVRREGGVVYVKNAGAEHDTPYVKVNGLWKVSVRDVLLTAVRAKLGKNIKFEEADLHTLAGKTAKVITIRSEGVTKLAKDVDAGRVATPEALREAIGKLKRGP